MEMTEYEIRKSYEEAKHKKEQIKILAQLNDSTEQEIKRILEGGSSEEKVIKTYHHPNDATKQKIVEEYLAGGITMEELAEKYGVCKSSVQKYVNLYKNGESLARKQRKPKIRSSSKVESKGNISDMVALVRGALDSLYDAASAIVDKIEDEFSDYEDFSLYRNSSFYGVRIKKDGFLCEISKERGDKEND